MVTLRAGVGLLALVAAIPAFAKPHAAPPSSAPPPEPPTITRADGEAMMRGLFQQVDANHDGVLDADEQKALLDRMIGSGAPPPVVDSIRRMFTEGTGADGKVTLDSFLAARMAAFDKADTNHDGKLDPAEQKAARAAQGVN